MKHDYHLVDPSPYPLIGSIAATVMALGGVAYLKGLFGADLADRSGVRTPDGDRQA